MSAWIDGVDMGRGASAVLLLLMMVESLFVLWCDGRWWLNSAPVSGGVPDQATVSGRGLGPPEEGADVGMGGIGGSGGIGGTACPRKKAGMSPGSSF
jgi:hypothetical protein